LVPWDQILTEETASETIIDRTKTVWIVDPIDGTKNYATGSDVFAVLIGRCTNGIPDLWVSHFPALKKTFYAQKGWWAFLNGKKLEKINESTNNPYQFSRPSNMEFTFDGTSYHNQRAETLPWVKSYSCLGRSIMQVALSKLEWVGGITQRWKRDTCSGHVILEEVGWKFTTSNGDALDYSTPSHSWSTWCIASKATAHQKIVDFIPAVK
jgi:myo-inositol-1(or 4)-monophosphatase